MKLIIELLNRSTILNQSACIFSLGYMNDSLHLAQKYGRIFVSGHYLFGEVKCKLQGSDNIQGPKSVHIFALN